MDTSNDVSNTSSTRALQEIIDENEPDEEETNQTWNRVYPNESNFVIDTIPIENSFTQDVITEIKALLQQVNLIGGSCSFENAFDIFFGPTSSWFAELISLTNEGLSRLGKSRLRGDEIFQFLETILLCHYYDCSPSVLSDPQNDDLLTEGVMRLSRFMEISKSFDAVVASSSGGFPFAGIFQQFSHASAKLGKRFSIIIIQFLVSLVSKLSIGWPGCKYCIIDDDKFRHRSEAMESMGLAVLFHRDESPGPTFHAVASCVTGLILSLYPEQRCDSTKTCIAKVLKQLNRSSVLDEVDLQGKSIALDRGYNSRSVAALLTGLGAKHVGTIAKNKGSSFSYGQRPKGNVRSVHISEEGVKSAFWVSSLPDADKVDERMLELCFRNNKHLVLLTSTMSQYDQNHWSIEFQHVDPSVHATKILELPNTTQLTLEQGYEEWFVLRWFRFTSSVVSKLLLRLVGISDLPFSTDIKNDLNELITAIGLQPSSDWRTFRANGRHGIEKFKVEQLKNMCKEVGIPCSNKTKHLLLDSLDSYLESHRRLSDKEIIELCVSQWFLQPQKNKFVTEGLRNEPVILSKLSQFLLQHHIVIRNDTIKTPGLIAMLHREWLATSIDGYVVFGRNEMPDKDAAIEIKSHFSVTAINAARRRRLDQGAFCVVTVGDTKAFVKAIPDKQHRIQIVHHATVLNLEYVFYVEATESDICRVVLVNIDTHLKSLHTQVLTGFKDGLLEWVYDVSRTNALPNLDDYHYCGDHETLLLCLTIWRKLRELARQDGVPLPPAIHLQPSLISLWDKLKGGVDIYSRHLANIHQPFGHLHQPMVVVERLIQTALLNIFQIKKCISIGSKLSSDPQFFTGLSHIRSYSADHSGTFKECLNEMIHLLWKRYSSWNRSSLKAKRNRPSSNEDQPPPSDSNPVETLHIPTDAVVSTQVMSQDDFELPPSGCKRKTAAAVFETEKGYKFRRTRFHDVIQDEHEDRKVCFICNRKCSHRCVTCQQYLCTKKHTAHGTTCWHKFHCDKIIPYFDRRP